MAKTQSAVVADVNVSAETLAKLAAVNLFLTAEDARKRAAELTNAQPKGLPAVKVSERCGGPLAGRTLYSASNSVSRSKETVVAVLALVSGEYLDPPSKKRGRKGAIEGL